MSIEVGKLFELLASMTKSPIVCKAVVTVSETKASYTVKGDEEQGSIEEMLAAYQNRSLENYVPSERYLKILNEFAKGPFSANPELVSEIRNMILDLCPEAYVFIGRLHPVQLMAVYEYLEKLSMIYDTPLPLGDMGEIIAETGLDIEKCQKELTKKKQEVDILDRCIQNVRMSLAENIGSSECQMEKRKMLDNWHCERMLKSRKLELFSKVLTDLETRTKILEELSKAITG